jgi:hypothetical protein
LAGLEVQFLPLEAGVEAAFEQAYLRPGFDRAIIASADRLVSAENDGHVFRGCHGHFVSLDLGVQRVSLGLIGFKYEEAIELIERFKAQYGFAKASIRPAAKDRMPASEVVGGTISSQRPSDQSQSSFERTEAELNRAFADCGIAIKEVFVAPFESFGSSARLLATDHARWIQNSKDDAEAWLQNSKEQIVSLYAKANRLVNEPREVMNDAIAAAREIKVSYASINRAGCRELSSFLVKGAITAPVAKAVANRLAPEVSIPGGPKLVTFGDPEKAKLVKDAIKNELSPAAQKALNELKEFCDNMPDAPFRPAHRLKIENGRGVIKIGYLLQDQTRFKRLALRAIQTGAISEIDAGEVVGPKVLALLNEMRKIKTESGAPVRFSGRLPMFQIDASITNDRAFSSHEPIGHPKRYTTSDIQAYERALNELGVKEACMKFYRSESMGNCIEIHFRFDNSSGAPVQWSNHGE